MKIVICTTPIRPVPTSYPPFGSMALTQRLRAAGYDPYCCDMDGLASMPGRTDPPGVDLQESAAKRAGSPVSVTQRNR